MKKRLWCWNHHILYPYSHKIDEFVYKCIDIINDCPSAITIITYYDILIYTSENKISLWNQNKFYAWLSNGSIDGEEYRHVSPSLSAMYDFKALLEKEGFDLYPKKEKSDIKFDLTKLKC